MKEKKEEKEEENNFNKEESDDEHFGYKEHWYKGPIRIIIGLFLILLLIMWLVPAYGIKQNPEPKNIPSLEELNVPEMEIPEVNSNKITSFIQTTSEIKQIADKIVTLSCTKTHRVCNAKAIFYFVYENFNYINDFLAFEYYKTL